jgi:MFS family permease
MWRTAYIPGIMYFSINVSFASLPLFVPTIISQMGSFSKIQSNGLSAPPYLLNFFVILIVCWLSDRFELRGPFCATMAVIAAIGFILQATTESTASRYVGVFLAVQVFCCVSLTLAWTANIHSTESKRAGGMTVLATIGQCGPLLGTNVFPESEKPYYRKGMWISASFCLLIAVCSVALSCILIAENKKMEREGIIPPKGEGVKDGLQDHVKRVEEGRKGAPRYRYIW